MKTRIKIYQQNVPTFRVDKVEDIYLIGKENDEYHEVWSEEHNGCWMDSSLEVLEKLYCKFNDGVYPEGFKGHSLSVGDIVTIETFNRNELGLGEEDPYEKKAFICKRFGWGDTELMTYEEYNAHAEAEIWSRYHD